MGVRRGTSARTALFAVLLSIALPSAAIACDLTYLGKSSPGGGGWTVSAAPGVRAAPASCPTASGDTDPIAPDEVINGEFGADLEASYVMLPFQVPAGTTAVRVKYCYDQPDMTIPGAPGQSTNTLDLGLYEPRPGAGQLWGEDEFRGWGGSSHPDVTVSENGFSSEADYLAAPKLHRRGFTTRGFEPGPIPAGEWAVELGAGSITSQTEGDSDGKVAWRVEIDYTGAADYADHPYAPAAYDTTPANTEPGWYAGDLHVHADHSALGDAPMSETFDYGFKPLSEGGAGLDFITLSDYVSDTSWGEIGRYQGDHPGKLIERSTEVITYHGHTNNHGSHTFVDYRTGPIYERASGGGLTLLRGAAPASRIFDDVHAADGWTQINHPTIFPSEVPGFASFCRGCPWDYSDTDTDYSKVDAIEVATGPAGLKAAPYPGPNPFTPLAVQFYEHALDTGAHIAAVGVSDSHKAGRDAGNTTDVTASVLGQATTVVRADELSEQGIEDGVKAGHTYVKIWGNDGPDLRFTADVPSSPPAIMGDTVDEDSTQFHVNVTGAGPGATRPGLYTLMVFKDGLPVIEVPIPSDDFSFDFPSFGLGRYRLQVMRTLTGGLSVEDVSSPIYLEAAGPPSDDDADDDGILDGGDNCPVSANPGQENLDGDPLGDACDADDDGDHVLDTADACPRLAGAAANSGCPLLGGGVGGGTAGSAPGSTVKIKGAKAGKRCKRSPRRGKGKQRHCRKRR